MDIYALIPLKKLETSKTRISNISLEARKKLSKAMLFDIVKSTLEAKSISETFVISPDHEISAFAKTLGAKTILETAQRGLNIAVSEGTYELEKRGAECVLVILGDVPLITPRLLDILINKSSKAISRPWVVIAPSKDNGTNILLRTPPEIIPTKYGKNSSIIHMNIARYRQVPCSIFRSSRLMHDIDTFQDFALIRKYGFETQTFQVLQKLKFL